MSIRMFVADLDGTLLNDKGEVSRGALAAIERLRSRGVEFIPATGRSLPECVHVMKAIRHEGRMIAAGGALVHECRRGDVLLRRPIAADLVKRLVEVVSRHGHLAHLLQDHTATTHDYLMIGEQEFDPATKWWFDTLPLTYRRIEKLTDMDAMHHTVRVGTVALGDELGAVAQDVEATLGGLVTAQHWPALTAEKAVQTRTHLLETFAARVSKWTSVAALAALDGVHREEIAAIGDGLNDFELIREAGLGMAMGNADPRIAAVARVQVATNSAEGFAESVERALAS